MTDDSGARTADVESEFLRWPSTRKRTEKRLWSAFRAGRQIDLSPNGKPGRNSRVSTRRAVVRAEVIAAMLRGGSGSGNTARLALCGAQITGQLDLSDARIEPAITLLNCVFDQPIVLAEARLGALTLDGSKFPGIEAANLEVSSDLRLSQVRSSRTVNLTGAHFHRDVRLSGARLSRGPDQEIALAADYLVVDGSVACDGGFEAAGTVTMAGARVNGSIRLDRAKITADGLPKGAFYGDGMTVGYEFNAQGLITEGEVRLVNVSIDSALDLRGAMLTNGRDVALRLDRAEILSSLYCDSGFTAVGDVNAIGAHVKGSVYFVGAELGTPRPTPGAAVPRQTGAALRLIRAKIDGDLGCWDSFTAHGTIDLSRLSVAGEFNLVTTDLQGYPTAADLTNGRFTTLVISGEPPIGLLDFTNAKADFFRDGPAHREKGAIVLDGFEYNSIQMTHVTVQQRKQWLLHAMAASKRKSGGHDGYMPQPYDQLVKAYRSIGDERAAELIAVAREDQRYRTMPWRSFFAKICRGIYGITLGYGYRLQRAFLLLPVLYLISVLMIHVAQKDDAFVAVSGIPPPNVTAAHCTSTYPCLSQWAYPADWVVPIINLHQSEYWQPDAHSAIGNVTRDWLYATTILGWAVTTLLVGAFTGLIRKD